MTTCPSGPRAWDFSCPARDLEIEVGMPPAAGRDPTGQPSNAGRPRGPGPVTASPAAARALTPHLWGWAASSH